MGKNTNTPKNDRIFKRLFGSKGNEEILRNFLESILETEIDSVTLDLSTELLPDFSDGKKSVVDVRANLGDKTQVNIELQMDSRGYSEARCLHYWGKLYSNSVGEGEDYAKAKKTICIWIVDELIYKDFEKFDSSWRILEGELGLVGHFKEFEIHIIELQKFRKNAIIKPRNKEFWLWFIDYTNRERIELGCLENERIKEAREQLKKITSDKALMNQIIAEEMYERDQNAAINRAKEEGMQKRII